MKRYALAVLVVGAACSAKFESGKTECSDKKECPSGYSCSDDGTSRTHYCFDNKGLGCTDDSAFYCSQTRTCWTKPGVCATVTNCGTTSVPRWLMCENPAYHPSCSGTSCLPGSVVDAGSTDGGTGGTAGRTGTGGAPGTGGMAGSGGNRDAGLDGARDAGATGGASTGSGVRDGGAGGVPGSGGMRDAGVGGSYGSGGSSGRGGSGGTTPPSALCSGTPPPCSGRTVIGSCKNESGCAWDATTSTCSGTPASCSSYTSGTWCLYNDCKWAGTYACSATPTTPTCTGSLTSSSNTCQTCIVNSCCGQMTACNNDATCLSTLYGSAWNSYIDCVVNCCGSASACAWW